MTELKDREALKAFIEKQEGTLLSDTEAGMIIEYLQSDNLYPAFEEGKYYLLSAVRKEEKLPFDSFMDIVIRCTRKAETMAEGMINQINIYNNGEDENFFEVISQDSGVLADLTGRLRRKEY